MILCVSTEKISRGDPGLRANSVHKFWSATGFLKLKRKLGCFPIHCHYVCFVLQINIRNELWGEEMVGMGEELSLCSLGSECSSSK